MLRNVAAGAADRECVAMKVAVLMDVEALPEEDPALEGRTEEIRLQTEYDVVQALRDMGHEARPLAFTGLIESATALRDMAPDVVFNLTEHAGGDRRRDVHVAAMLDLLQLPYTGCGPDALLFCRDKALSKRLLARAGVAVPAFVEWAPGGARPSAKLRFPVVVKPLWEDGSDGIAMAALTHAEAALRARARHVHSRLRQPAICEEYVEGREIYISVVGDEQPEALPPRELIFGRTGRGAPRIATRRVKTNAAYRHRWELSFEFADLSPAEALRARRVGLQVFRLLRLRDCARLDFRLTPAGEFVFIEANPNPDLWSGDEVAKSWMRTGRRYCDLIDNMLTCALRRAGPRAPKKKRRS